MNFKALCFVPFIGFCALAGQLAASSDKTKEEPRKIEATKASVRAELIEHVANLKSQIASSRSNLESLREIEVRFAKNAVPMSGEIRTFVIGKMQVEKDILVHSQRELTIALTELAKFID